MSAKDVWKFFVATTGELCVMTVSRTQQRESSATCSDSGNGFLFVTLIRKKKLVDYLIFLAKFAILLLTSYQNSGIQKTALAIDLYFL